MMPYIQNEDYDKMLKISFRLFKHYRYHGAGGIDDAMRMYGKRSKGYRSMGYEIIEDIVDNK